MLPASLPTQLYEVMYSALLILGSSECEAVSSPDTSFCNSDNLIVAISVPEGSRLGSEFLQ